LSHRFCVPVIDLHTHTTASDGLCSPTELVSRAHAAGVSILSVTDHDTVAGCAEARRACEAAAIQFVEGIEITAMAEGGDVHVLGYFIDTEAAALRRFLEEQRRRRLERIRLMLERLAGHGIRLDAASILGPGIDDTSRTIGRPAIARALVDRGDVASTSEAFDKWLARGRPAFVAREGPTPQEVFEQIHQSGGIAALAHPGLLQRDSWIEPFARAGLDALEAYHVDHDHIATDRYLQMAAGLGLAVSGGSDYHGDESHGSAGPGAVSLPPEAFSALRRRAASRATASGASTSS
jgi:3',5'-nucleoside bisphosphate phosphatase